MKSKIALIVSIALTIIPVTASAFVSCRDTDRGCTLEQNLQLIKDANALGLSQAELKDVLHGAIQQITEKLALLSSSGRTINCVDLQSDMWIGKTDDQTNGEVSKLQGFLLSQGYGDSASDFRNPTGYYGAMTAVMVVGWQKAHGMDFVTTKSGVGPMTRSKMACSTSN